MSETILNIVWTVHEIPAFHVHHSSNTCQKQHNFYPVQNSTEHKSMTTMWTCSDVTKKNGRTQSVWVEWSVSRDELARVNKCVKGIWAYFIFSLCLSLLRYNSLHVSPLVVEKKQSETGHCDFQSPWAPMTFFFGRKQKCIVSHVPSAWPAAFTISLVCRTTVNIC